MRRCLFLLPALIAAPALAAPVMSPSDPATFCALVHVQQDGQTMKLDQPVKVDGTTYRRKIRAGMDSDDGIDVYGEIMNFCSGRLKLPPEPHNP
jgi:hypothetical protein